jgi:hypothetical protein
VASVAGLEYARSTFLTDAVRVPLPENAREHRRVRAQGDSIVDQLPRNEKVFPAQELFKRAFCVIPLSRWWSVVVLSVLTAAPAATAQQARFWLSTMDMSTNGPIAPNVPGAIGNTQYVHIWARPETFASGSFKWMQNVSLNLVSTNPVVDFLDNAITVHNPQNIRFQYVRDSDSDPSITSEWLEEDVLMLNEPDSIRDIQGFSINSFSYLGFGGSSCFPTSSCELDQNNKPAWLIASVGYRPVRAGTTNFFLQIGSNGMNHFGESTGDMSVLFGLDTGASVTYNAEFDRDETLSGDTPDLVLQATAGVPGDYNRNNVVDAGDYVVWRKSFGQMGSGLPADGSGAFGVPDGKVDEDDFEFWKSQFGNRTGDGSSLMIGSSPAVPEPSAISLMVLGLMATVRRRAAA